MRDANNAVVIPIRIQVDYLSHSHNAYRDEQVAVHREMAFCHRDALQGAFQSVGIVDQANEYPGDGRYLQSR